MKSADRISSNVEGWSLETWFRLDKRITWSDITDRIHPRYRPYHNTLQMARMRFRDGFHLSAWGPPKYGRQTANELAIDAAVRAAGISLEDNTTRGLTPGLVDPMNPNGRRIAVPYRWLPKTGNVHQRPSNNNRLKRRAMKEAWRKANNLVQSGDSGLATTSINSPAYVNEEITDDEKDFDYNNENEDLDNGDEIEEEVENRDDDGSIQDVAETCKENFQVLSQPIILTSTSTNFNSVRLATCSLPPQLLQETTVELIMHLAPIRSISMRLVLAASVTV